MGLSIGGRTGSWGMEERGKRYFDSHTKSDVLRRVLQFGAVCGRQDLGSGSATDTFKTGHATSPLVGVGARN